MAGDAAQPAAERRLTTVTDASSPDAGLSELVDELLTLVDGLLPASARRDLEEGRERLEQERVNLVVLGEFKRGKSTLVNALVGTEVVPTGVLPLTAAVTVIRAGKDSRLHVRFTNGGRQELSPSRIADFATEAGNPNNRRGVELLTVEIPSPLLEKRVQLVDTPGIGSVYVHNTETALGFLGQVDAALFTLSADQPLSEAEAQLVRDAAARVPRIFFALNKVDHLSERERDQTTSFTRQRLRDTLGVDPELYPISARSGEGLDALRDRIERFAMEERGDVLECSVRRLARDLARDAAQAIRFEAHTVELPLAELERSLDEFRRRSSELSQAREEAAELLHSATARLVAERVNEPLLALASREGAELVDALHTFVAEQGGVSPRVLADRLESWCEDTIRERFERLAAAFEAQLADDLAALEARYAERIERILEDIDEAAAEVFGERSGCRAPKVGMRRQSRFTFKLRDLEREMLDQLASVAAASVPGRVGRRLVTRQAEERLLTLLDRHAGRLRSDLAERVRQSGSDYARELAFIVGETIASVEAAVERATREQRSGRLHVTTRLDELRRVERRTAEIATLLEP
ncbi:MAG TPA: dynamin family protein [Gaiellaceae bacterium]|nr:dynamin family protein [Gaiellaceae bacterium]